MGGVPTSGMEDTRQVNFRGFSRRSVLPEHNYARYTFSNLAPGQRIVKCFVPHFLRKVWCRHQPAQGPESFHSWLRPQFTSGRAPRIMYKPSLLPETEWLNLLTRAN